MTPFPISETNPVEHDGPLPKAADCVVIGGGVIGICTALFLARSGQKVVVLEKGRIAGEQSSRNWGWIRVQGRDAAEIPIAIEAQNLWRELAPQLDVDIGLKQVGVAYLANTKKQVQGHRKWLDHARDFGLDSHLLSTDQVRDLIPAAATTWQGGLLTPSDMRAEPFLAVPALARLAAREGVTIVENCAVRILDIAGGRIKGVATEQGMIESPKVVVAAGAWSSLFLRNHGISLPQLSVKSTAAQTEALGEVFTGGAADKKLAFRHRADGGYTLAPAGYHEMFIGPDAFRNLLKFMPQFMTDPFGTALRPKAPRGFPDAWNVARKWSADDVSPFENLRVLNPAPNMAKVAGITRHFTKNFPNLGSVKIKSAWAGMIDVMPDLVPVVDRVSALSGLVVSTGMCGHGFGIGPAFGRINADLVLGRDPGHDLTRFRLSRFSDGSKLNLGTSL